MFSRIVVAAFAAVAVGGIALAQTGKPAATAAAPAAAGKTSLTGVLDMLDTAGVKVGMTSNDARAALGKAGFPTVAPHSQFVGREYYKDFLTTLNGFAETKFMESMGASKNVGQPNMDAISVLFHGPGNENRAWAVHRERRYDKTEAATLQATGDALTQKYGQPSDTYGDPSRGVLLLKWYYGADGKLLKAAKRGNCDVEIHGVIPGIVNTAMAHPLNNNATANVPPFRFKREGCASGIEMALNFDANKLVTNMTLTMVDFEGANIGSEKSYAMIDALEKAKAAKTVGAAAKNKPDL